MGSRAFHNDETDCAQFQIFTHNKLFASFSKNSAKILDCAITIGYWTTKKGVAEYIIK